VNDDPLVALKDIYLPASPPWWPPAPGWWLLAGIFVAGLVWLTFRVYRRWQAFAPVRSAKQLVSEVFNSDATDIFVVHQCNEILKRLLVLTMNQSHLAQESGEAWLQALDRLADCEEFSNGPGRVLGTDRFAPNQIIDRPGLLNCVNALLIRVKPPSNARGRNA
jgi:hypothetical protein